MRLFRRAFLITAGVLGVGFMAIFFIEPWVIRKIYYRIKDRFEKPRKLSPDSERAEIVLPPKGETVSVEMALNSRCNSDYDENPKRFHWGMFDRMRKLSDAQIEKIIHLARIPRFTDRKVEIQSERNMLTSVIDNRPSGLLRDWMMVESGMQQQAVGLVCAALGVGMRFSNLGKDGTAISNTEHATTKIKVDAMRPTYDGLFWTSSPPAGRKPWSGGNLPDPVRDGDMPLISAMENLKTEGKNGREATDQSISQLVWAARGRTPHFYKSKPWGMTIPTAQGKQNTSCVYFTSENTLYRYVNWDKNGPTHSLEVLGDIDTDLDNQLLRLFPSFNCFFVIGIIETSGIALWEVGYQVLNILLQAHSLNVTYQAVLLAETHKTILRRMHIEHPVVLVAVNRGNEHLHNSFGRSL